MSMVIVVVVVEFVFMPMIRKALVICYTYIYIFHLVFRSIRTLVLFIHSHVLMVYTANYVTKMSESEWFTGDTPN